MVEIKLWIFGLNFRVKPRVLRIIFGQEDSFLFAHYCSKLNHTIYCKNRVLYFRQCVNFVVKWS